MNLKNYESWRLSRILSPYFPRIRNRIESLIKAKRASEVSLSFFIDVQFSYIYRWWQMSSRVNVCWWSIHTSKDKKFRGKLTSGDFIVILDRECVYDGSLYPFIFRLFLFFSFLLHVCTDLIFNSRRKNCERRRLEVLANPVTRKRYVYNLHLDIGCDVLKK